MAQHPTADGTPALEPAIAAVTLLVAAVIVHDRAQNSVLLLQRGPNAKFAQGMWDLPVGKSELGEPITQTAVRELYEETGLTVDPKHLRPVHIIHGAYGVGAPNRFFTVVFATEEWDGEPINMEPHKHAQVRWINERSIPDEFVPTTNSALTAYLNETGPQVSLRGWS